MAALRAIAASLAAAALLPSAYGHGRMTSPGARNGGDNGVVAGGPATVHASGQYIHGVCGNKAGLPQSLNEAKGPVATYRSGDVAEFRVAITAHHIGFFEFELCDDASQLSEECFARHRLLKEGCQCACSDGSHSCEACDACRRWWKPLMKSETGSWMARGYQGPTLAGDHLVPVTFVMSYSIPEGVRTQNGVIRWHYLTTNSCSTPSSKPEEFWNCADVVIEGEDGEAGEAKDPASFNAGLRAMAVEDLTPDIGSGKLLGRVYAGCPVDDSGAVMGVGAAVEYEGWSCSDETRTCVAGSGGSSGVLTPAPGPAPPAGGGPAPAPASGSGCVRNTDCASNLWCNDLAYDSYCPRHSAGECPSPQCITAEPEPEPEPEPETEAPTTQAPPPPPPPTTQTTAPKTTTSPTTASPTTTPKTTTSQSTTAPTTTPPTTASPTTTSKTTTTPEPDTQEKTCVATPGLNRGVNDAACKKCEGGYKWWPCNEAILCKCTGGPALVQRPGARGLKGKAQGFLAPDHAMLQQASVLRGTEL